MSQKTIVIDDAVPYAEEIFSHLGKVIKIPGREITPKDVHSADALIIRSRTQVNQALLSGSSVSFVGSTVVGLDHVDQNYLAENQVHFYSAQGCNANSVAEFIINTLYELAESFSFDLTNKTLGIIGVGNVGSRIYEKAKILGIKCLLNDPPKTDADPSLFKSAPYVNLDDCLQADIITVHTPLTTKGKYATRNLIDKLKLDNLTPQQILINAARGGIINEDAWIETKTLANVIDCWENEPYINEKLYQSAWLATPHIAGHSLDAKVAGSSMVYQELCRFWNQQEKYDWQKQLPQPPQALQFNSSSKLQSALQKTFKQAHDVFSDDLAIRDKKIAEVHKKYEYYRRNYPIYREWQQHKVVSIQQPETSKLLKRLGFSVI